MKPKITNLAHARVAKRRRPATAQPERWGRNNWALMDKALAEEAEEARYNLRRQHRKSAYREIVALTIAGVAVICGVVAIIAEMLP